MDIHNLNFRNIKNSFFPVTTPKIYIQVVTSTKCFLLQIISCLLQLNKLNEQPWKSQYVIVKPRLQLLDKRTNELAMVVKDIRVLRDLFEPWLDEVWWKFAWTEIKNSSVKKYKWEQFRTWKDLDRETIFVYSINSFWIRLVVFCEFEFGQIVKFVAKSLCTIFEYSSFWWTIREIFNEMFIDVHYNPSYTVFKW